MTDRLSVITTENTVPYENLALEQYLLGSVGKGQCILYLWQNQRTVVIGRNQNPWQECRIEALLQDGGYLVRRISGGGAVFHDLGNLNFTFVTMKEEFDVEQQTRVILEAVRKLGAKAERTGRNDITVEGKKFSGNAYYRSGDRCLHHGTILIDADKEDMSKYLNVSSGKLRSNSVESVRSRVANLTEILPLVTVGEMKERLIQSFLECYGKPVEFMDRSSIDWSKVKESTQQFDSWEWNYGRKLPFDYRLTYRFAWGEAELQLQVNQGKVTEALVYSDALDTELFPVFCNSLRGVRFHPEDLGQAIDGIETVSEVQKQIRKDLRQLIFKLE